MGPDELCHDYECECAACIAAEQRLMRTVKQALEVAAETLRTFDEGDPSTETGWKHDELLDAWKQCQAALEALSGIRRLTPTRTKRGAPVPNEGTER